MHASSRPVAERPPPEPLRQRLAACPFCPCPPSGRSLAPSPCQARPKGAGGPAASSSTAPHMHACTCACACLQGAAACMHRGSLWRWRSQRPGAQPVCLHSVPVSRGQQAMADEQTLHLPCVPGLRFDQAQVLGALQQLPPQQGLQRWAEGRDGPHGKPCLDQQPEVRNGTACARA